MVALLGISATTSAALMVNARAASVAEENSRADATQPDEDKNDVDGLNDAGQKKSGAPESAGKRKTKTTAKPAFRFQGRVVDPNGKPVKRATIHYTHWLKSGSRTLATANDQGKFDVTISSTNQFYSFLREEGGTFVATADGYGPAVKSAHECVTTGAMANRMTGRMFITECLRPNAPH